MMHLTEGGIPGLRQIPYGLHLCHFYSRREDLAEILVPYFRFGLRNQERCIWITGAPFPSAVARAELARQMPDFEELSDPGRLQIIDGERWLESLDGAQEEEQGVMRWLREEESALAAGYAGLRIAGNMPGAARGDWFARMRHEDAASHAFLGRRILALCGYDRQGCRAPQLAKVIATHHYVLHRTDGAWQVLPHTAAGWLVS